MNTNTTVGHDERRATVLGVTDFSRVNWPRSRVTDPAGVPALNRPVRAG